MHIIIGMDDTDNQESQGTGHLAQHFSEKIEGLGLGTCSGITRHQLFVHEQIPYTSHNSAMCFEAQIVENTLQQIIDLGIALLEDESAAGSDPGLCVVVVDEALPKDPLITFGQAAKTTILTKTDAYHLAHTLGVHLSEHGGTGGGVIGALAGTGLRLSGNDGRFRGWLNVGKAGEVITAGALRAHHFIDDVRSDNGFILNDETPVMLGDDEIKIIYKDWQRLLLVTENHDPAKTLGWMTLTRKQAKEY